MFKGHLERKCKNRFFSHIFHASSSAKHGPATAMCDQHMSTVLS